MFFPSCVSDQDHRPTCRSVSVEHPPSTSASGNGRRSTRIDVLGNGRGSAHVGTVADGPLRRTQKGRVGAGYLRSIGLVAGRSDASWLVQGGGREGGWRTRSRDDTDRAAARQPALHACRRRGRKSRDNTSRRSTGQLGGCEHGKRDAEEKEKRETCDNEIEGDRLVGRGGSREQGEKEGRESWRWCWRRRRAALHFLQGPCGRAGRRRVSSPLGITRARIIDSTSGQRQTSPEPRPPRRPIRGPVL